MKTSSLVRVHLIGQPEGKFQEHYLPSGELTVLQELLGVFSPGIRFAELKKKIWDKNKTFNTASTEVFVEKLVEKGLVGCHRRPSTVESTWNIDRRFPKPQKSFLHAFTRIDSLTFVISEQQVELEQKRA